MKARELKKRLLTFSDKYACVALYDSNLVHVENTKYDWLFACGNKFQESFKPDLDSLQEFFDIHSHEFIFGILGYDLKEEIEGIASQNTSFHSLPDWCFFIPEILVKSVNGEIIWIKGSEDVIASKPIKEVPNEVYHFHPQISKDQYLESISKIQGHLQEGNIYELNFCREFHCQSANDIPIHGLFFKLQTENPSSFSSFFRIKQKVLISSSPERYLMRSGNKLISEPIKGTIPRSADSKIDLENFQILKNSEKERRENVMIVDLVRNDLSKIAKPHSVKVEALYSIRSLPKVHQMVSVISAELQVDTSLTDILKASFPMGSMTGAPKVAAMQFAEEFESFKRAWYSGSVGYIEPNGDFDFNVIIRSLIVDRENRKMSIAAGGAITILSDAEMEFQESEWKVQSVLKSIEAIVVQPT